MSRTDNTDPRRVLASRWQDWSFHRGDGRELRRAWQKRQRQHARVALVRGEEPEPTRTRGSVKYDYW